MLEMYNDGSDQLAFSFALPCIFSNDLLMPISTKSAKSQSAPVDADIAAVTDRKPIQIKVYKIQRADQ